MHASRILPPVYFLGALLLAVALHYALPLARVIPRPWHLVGVLLIAIGMILIIVPARTFKARDTAIKPFDVSSALVQDGFFSVSRNPMYLGMVLVLLGVATLLRSATPFVVSALLAVVLQTRFIRHEEQMLESTFGEDYRSYKKRVRRWL